MTLIFCIRTYIYLFDFSYLQNWVVITVCIDDIKLSAVRLNLQIIRRRANKRRKRGREGLIGLIIYSIKLGFCGQRMFTLLCHTLFLCLLTTYRLEVLNCATVRKDETFHSPLPPTPAILQLAKNSSCHPFAPSNTKGFKPLRQRRQSCDRQYIAPDHSFAAGLMNTISLG